MKQGVAIPCMKHLQNIVSGFVLHSLGLLCRAGDYLSNSDCAALRAMTGPEGESAEQNSWYLIYQDDLPPEAVIAKERIDIQWFAISKCE